MNRRAPTLTSLASLVFVVAGLVVTSDASAVPWVFKYDQFPDDIGAAAGAVNGGSFYTQPGFVAGEAFGQVYEPDAAQYPIQIQGLDLILAAPPAAAAQLFANAIIEIYNSDSKSADPQSAPIFSISTADLLDAQTNQLGFPLTGNAGLRIQFDFTDPQNHPPVIDDGRIWVVIRFSDNARDMTAEWGTIQCGIIDLGGLGSIGCGCQNVGTLHDNAITPKANVIHHVTPLGQCSGNKVWAFMETLDTGSGFTINGDVVLRLHADVAAAPCVRACDGRECGDDGCGGVCGTCADRELCEQGQCIACQADCTNRDCGPDGCGGSCGTCEVNESCELGLCEANCAPQCSGNECGPDGCGGVCGPGCGNGETCLSGQCAPTCATQCSGRECGPDGCGGQCGTCGSGLVCADGQCAACAPACDGKVCGDDGCGGTCGTCEGGASCQAGACVSACAPACDGKTCGDDGCGGSCGTCGVGFCDATGTCAGVVITSISPAFGRAGLPTPVSIIGQGFEDGARVKLGGRDMESVDFTGASLISAVVPADLAPGRYTVIVVNPGGELAQLPDGFEVQAATATTVTGDEAGCSAGGPAGMLGTLLFSLLPLLMGIFSARRRA